MAISKRILYTRHDGGVAVCLPSADIFAVMQCGGYWDDRPRGFLQAQIERQISDGIAPDHARRFAMAVAFGGVSEAEAWGIIRDRDCARRGTLHELIDADELPGRWFRDAWKRSANGGPVGVDLNLARPVQWDRLYAAVERENKNRARSYEAKPELKPEFGTIRSAIRNARDEDELARVWPDGLPVPRMTKSAPTNPHPNL